MPRTKNPTFRSSTPSDLSPPHSSSSSPPIDPEYADLAAKIAARPLLKERPFSLTPPNHPFVQRLVFSDLSGLVTPRDPGNDTFVRHFYTYARYHDTFDICFRGVTISQPFTPAAIRDHYHLPSIPSCHYADLIRDYPWDDVLRTLCPEGAEWHQPRVSQRYIRRADLRPEARPWLHLICNNIHPTSHLAFVPKEQALYIYLLMAGRPVDLALAISSALRQSVLTSTLTHSILFPHLVSDLFRAHQVPELPTDKIFAPASLFRYIRLKQPRLLVPPPPPHSPSPPPPPPHSPSPPPSPPSPPVVAATHPDVPPQDTHPILPPSSLSPFATLTRQVSTLTHQVATLHAAFLRSEAQRASDRRYHQQMYALLAEHLHIPLPPTDGDASVDPTSSAAAPPDLAPDDPAA